MLGLPQEYDKLHGFTIWQIRIASIWQTRAARLFTGLIHTEVLMATDIARETGPLFFL